MDEGNPWPLHELDVTSESYHHSSGNDMLLQDFVLSRAELDMMNGTPQSISHNLDGLDSNGLLLNMQQDIAPATTSSQVFTTPIYREPPSSHAPEQSVEAPGFPVDESWPGEYNFVVRCHSVGDRSQAATWSPSLKKLFVEMNKTVAVEMEVSHFPDPSYGRLVVRATPYFTRPGDMNEAVLRCINHSQAADDTNKEFQNDSRHLIRCEMKSVWYDERKPRLSVVTPLLPPSPGSKASIILYKFMCLGSCSGGINRRPIKIVFNLELGERSVGNHCVPLRICACPARDRKLEEKKRAEKAKNAVNPVSAGKKMLKRPADEDHDVALLPVKGKKNQKIIQYILDALNVTDYCRSNCPDVITRAREDQQRRQQLDVPTLTCSKLKEEDFQVNFL